MPRVCIYAIPLCAEGQSFDLCTLYGCTIYSIVGVYFVCSIGKVSYNLNSRTSRCEASAFFCCVAIPSIISPHLDAWQSEACLGNYVQPQKMQCGPKHARGFPIDSV